MFSFEFREISKNTFFTEYLWGTASALGCYSQNQPLLAGLIGWETYLHLSKAAYTGL